MDRPSHTAAATILLVSLTLDEDYRRREVFPELRITSESKRLGSTYRFELTIELASAVLADAVAQCARPGFKRGLLNAYHAVQRSLDADLNGVVSTRRRVAPLVGSISPGVQAKANAILSLCSADRIGFQDRRFARFMARAIGGVP